MTLHAYLVDFDGTLADTREANYLAYARSLEEVGVVLSREEFLRQTHGKNWRQFLPVILKEHGSDHDPAKIAARKSELYKGTACDVRFNDALVSILQGRDSSIRTALVTSASTSNVEVAMSGRHDIKSLFEVTVTGDDVTRHKPDPQGFEIAASRLGVKACHCIVFEDSDVGVEAGLAFGAQVLRVSMGER
jgi:beta-phosphoglucomutase